MHCPKDKTELKQITKDEVVLDFCPTCRGVWLDRGELDKIIERSVEAYGQREEAEIGNESGKPDYPNIEHRPTYRAKGSNFLGALFDLDDPGVEGRRGFLGRK